MELLYLNEHISCRNYDKGPTPLIEVRKIEKSIPLEEQHMQSEILFLLKGEITYSFGMFNNNQMRQGQMLYLPVGYKLNYEADTETQLLFMRPCDRIRFCDRYKLEDLMHHMPEAQDIETEAPYIMEMNKIVKDYTNMLAYCVQKGLCCKYYYEQKIVELFYLFRYFYPKPQLGKFFCKALSCDSSFSHYVLQNYDKYQSLTELAASMNITLSGLEKRFKKVFNTSGYKWMNAHKAQKIYHAICIGESPFKKLSSEFGFASKSTFNDFCKKHLGETPGEIRKKNTFGYKMKNKGAITDNEI
jgi:AraC-like DNA-binding protein